MNPISFGDKISKLRRKNGLTQSDLANKLNISNKTVSKWERGLGYPEITMIWSLAKELHTTTEYLLREESDGIVIAGSLVADIINSVDVFPERSKLSKILDTKLAVGGCVPNVAINLVKIDSQLFVKALGRVGNDENGKFLLNTMKNFGVDVNDVTVDNTLPTDFCQVMSEKVSGTRTFFASHNGANSKFDESDVGIDNLECKIFHIGYILLLDSLDAADEEYGTKMAKLLSNIQKKRIKTSIDVISEDGGRYVEKVIPVLKYCNYVIINEIEASMVANISPRNSDGSINIENIKKIMTKLIEYGVKDKVFVHAPEAGFVMDVCGNFTYSPSLDLPKSFIKGSVGAGDAFCAGCLYGLYNKSSDIEILEFASAVAAQSLSHEDSVSGMKNKAEILALSKEYQRRKL